LEIALYRPEIPPNTGNIGRLCVNAGASLGIIGEPSFDLSEKSARRAGLDYWQYLQLNRYKDWDEFLSKQEGKRIFLISKFGKTVYAQVRFQMDDVLVFGRETSGLPPEILTNWKEAQSLFIPMQGESRSINLSNASAIVLFEAMRQIHNW
jgi:tRNA (cytidine/uridine-2'-O-)-methyltransferase